MKFLSIYKTKERATAPTEAEMCQMGKHIEEGMREGYLLSVEGCLPSFAGARVRIENGAYDVKDGPFTETKEVIGGFALMQANSKEEALAYVKRFLDVVGEGECELRQLFEPPV